MKEENYYEPIKNKLSELFASKTSNYYLEITANKTFSNKLKEGVESFRNLIFYFLKQASPDITGFVKKEHYSDFIVIEFKKEPLKIDDVYQTKKYQNLFNSKFTFLISLFPVPEEIKRLHKDNLIPTLLSGRTYSENIVLVQFDKNTNEFVEWYPENPFEKDSYWK